MDIIGLQQMYHDKQLSEAIIEPSTLGNGWVVECKDQQGQLVVLTDSLGHEKCYKNLDIATAKANEIGFSRVRIEESF